MATNQTLNKIKSNVALKMYDFDPDATTVTDIDWVDLSGYDGLMVTFFRTVGTSAVTLDIAANTESDGSGTDRVIASHAVGSEPDAVGDQIHLEITAEQVAAVGRALATPEALRYVTARVSVATGTDEGVVTYLRTKPRFAQDALTADIVA